MEKKINYKKLYKALAEKYATLEEANSEPIASQQFQFDRDTIGYYKSKLERLNRENAQLNEEITPLRLQLSAIKHSAAYLDYCTPEADLKRSEEWEQRARMMWKWMASLSPDIDLHQKYKQHNPNAEEWFE